MKKSAAIKLLVKHWHSLDELPDYYSFRCIIIFKEFGLSGKNCSYISTGLWDYANKCFYIDSRAMRKFTPDKWIALYDDID
jgi:hypothetical protein